MKSNLSQKIAQRHLVDGTKDPGSEIALSVDKTLKHDAIGLERAEARSAPQDVDHDLASNDGSSADKRLWLGCACRMIGFGAAEPRAIRSSGSDHMLKAS